MKVLRIEAMTSRRVGRALILGFFILLSHYSFSFAIPNSLTHVLDDGPATPEEIHFCASYRGVKVLSRLASFEIFDCHVARLIENKEGIGFAHIKRLSILTFKVNTIIKRKSALSSG